MKFLPSEGIFGPDCLQSCAALKKTETNFGEKDYCWFCGSLSRRISAYHMARVWYYDSSEQVILKTWKVSYVIHTLLLPQSVALYLQPRRDSHPILYPKLSVIDNSTAILGGIFVQIFSFFSWKLFCIFHCFLFWIPAAANISLSFCFLSKGEAWKS